MDDLSLVPNLELAAQARGAAAPPAEAEIRSSLAEANVDPPVNARDAARRGGERRQREETTCAAGTDDASADGRRGGDSVGGRGESATPPPETGVVGMLDLSDPSAPTSKPR